LTPPPRCPPTLASAQDEQAKALAAKLGFTGDLEAKAVRQFHALYKLFVGTDATQVEINPLAEGSVPGGAAGLIFAVDAKLNFDDNASFRQAEIYAQRDKSMEDPRDVAAEEAGLNYIGEREVSWELRAGTDRIQQEMRGAGCDWLVAPRLLNRTPAAIPPPHLQAWTATLGAW
jgi:hypothetical protein